MIMMLKHHLIQFYNLTSALCAICTNCQSYLILFQELDLMHMIRDKATAPLEPKPYPTGIEISMLYIKKEFLQNSPIFRNSFNTNSETSVLSD